MRIHNTYDQLAAAGGGIAIMVSWGGIRDKYVNGWQIYRLNADGKQLVTDKDAAWYHCQRKWFSHMGYPGTRHQKQAAELEEAKAWVAETYGEQGPWKRNRSRDYVPERINAAFQIPPRDDG